jgi:hypothetical protein
MIHVFPGRALLLVSVVLCCGIPGLSVAAAAQSTQPAQNDVARRLQDLEDRIARIEARLDMLGPSSAAAKVPPGLEGDLLAASIILSEVDPGTVRGWLITDLSYQTIARNCLVILDGGRLIAPTGKIPLDVIMAKYRVALGGAAERWIAPDRCNDLDSLKAAVLATWRERYSDVPAGSFQEIVESFRQTRAQQQKAVIEITSPVSGAEVGMEVVIEGIVRVDDITGQWPVVGVHPMLTSMTWIQSLPVKIDKTEEGYKFRCVAYCGTREQGVGEQFEFYGFLAPKGALKAADQLEALPVGMPVSSSVLVTRTRN